ncbi:hypothetical protein RhiirA4_483875 [Rhizophagus irregularis]|uniref:Uncharacterized protein n=1 Tax=Rhizophagus irregularis TaxID=588596 RepID=A0A2I1HN73_9GLOM|nr:hypothetical protein RhiirA4_483875 [Rhizophagus irregularis]
MKKGFSFEQVLDKVLDRCSKHQIVQLPNTASDDTVYFKKEKRTNELTKEVFKKSEVNASTKSTPAKRLRPEPDNAHNGNSNSCNDDSDPDNNSGDEVPDDSNDNGYNGYGRYNEYGKYDKGYYYHDEKYERRGFS